ncbi:alpha/beta fold hydrolase [Rhodococcoides fascians]|uniref:alpha/beta fold hydrolase n=1 Tax=Rhodococcoides fascians TaxID=1828 RepID=UPI001F5EE1DE|nr:alpha/beta hydrolase [Rhodococcus fascians]
MLPGVEGIEANEAVIGLLAENFSVVAPSHPGFGLSPRPDWCDSVEDLAYLYLQWIEEENLSDVHLVGFQFGGWTAAEMAVRNSSRLASLTLVDAVGIKVGGREDRDITDVFAISRSELDGRHYADPTAGPGDLTKASEELVLHIARNEEALTIYGWDPYLHNPRLQRWLHRINVPTLVTWGTEDGIVSPEYGRAYAAAIPAARFELIAEAGHRAQIEQPQRIAELIAEHLS